LATFQLREKLDQLPGQVAAPSKVAPQLFNPADMIKPRSSMPGKKMEGQSK
jgi:hypothetical protein